MTISYDGTKFHGWQRQFTTPERGVPRELPTIGEMADGRVELRTVQGVVQRAVNEVVRAPAIVQGASRTDAGVHAKAQCGTFAVEEETPRPPDEKIRRAINSKLPEDVLITQIERTHDDFDPISDCTSKGYRYTIHSGPDRPLWGRRFVWWTYEHLDGALMNEAAQHLVGTHDFATFAAVAHGRESTVRTIHHCSVTAEPAESPDGSLLTISVSGDGFLYNMVRIIAGTLMEAGRGRFEPEDMITIRDAADRARGGPTLGPSGLRLEWIEYPEFVVGEKWES
ncbi:MAG: tRNA pseudouridine synthase A [Planctomycetota bacterium]